MAPAFCAFQHFARPLRIGCDGDFYYKSFKSQKISTFWSHSWHGGHWKKILTLLTFYNASAALVCGFLIAILMMILKIFLDRLCISQKDNRLKALAIFSLAGFLKKSDVMLIVWDPTWAETCLTFFDYIMFSHVVFFVLQF